MKNAVKGIYKVFIGLIAMFIVLWIWPGGLTFFLVSVICTGGITLVVWLPLAYLVGSTLVRLYFNFRGVVEPDRIVGGEGAHQILNNDQLALVNFIKTSRVAQVTDDIIRKQLKDNGWDEAMIDGAFKFS